MRSRSTPPRDSVLAEAWWELLQPGSTAMTGRSVWRVGRVVVGIVIVGTNLVGAATALAVGILVMPLPRLRHPGHELAVNLVAGCVCVAAAVPTGVAVGTRGLRGLRHWLEQDRPATAAEKRAVLRAPLRLFGLQVVLWLTAAVIFGLLDASASAVLAVRAAGDVVLTGLATAAFAYLLTERIMRPVAARALLTGLPDRVAVPGVALRAILAWTLGTGVPLIGVVAVGALELGGPARGAIAPREALSTVVLSAIALTLGLASVALAARATADPADEVRRGLSRVEEGDLSPRLHAYDGTQMGRLQDGFNRMLSGLAERARIREALGVYLDPEVAERVVQEGTNLGGEDVEVTVMFVDVRGFTAYAEGRPAREVVASLNRLFGAVVPVVAEHGGRVDKFVGDGLLAVFGAPRRLVNHADSALAAALAVVDTVVSSRFGVGIGLNSGTVVAANVGGAGRLEFSVIGDAVNTASRVEAATRQTGDPLLITRHTLDLLGAGARRDVVFEERPDVSLEGKSESVAVYAPRRRDPCTEQG